MFRDLKHFGDLWLQAFLDTFRMWRAHTVERANQLLDWLWGGLCAVIIVHNDPAVWGWLLTFIVAGIVWGTLRLVEARRVGRRQPTREEFEAFMTSLRTEVESVRNEASDLGRQMRGRDNGGV